MKPGIFPQWKAKLRRECRTILVRASCPHRNWFSPSAAVLRPSRIISLSPYWWWPVLQLSSQQGEMGDDGFPGEQGGKVKRLEHFHFLMDKSFLIFLKLMIWIILKYTSYQKQFLMEIREKKFQSLEVHVKFHHRLFTAYFEVFHMNFKFCSRYLVLKGIEMTWENI